MEISDDWKKPGVYVLHFPGGKQYIGMSKRSVRARLLHHKSKSNTGSKLAVHSAMRAHGIDNVMVEVIFANDSRNLAEAEIALIAERKAAGVKLYNMTSGGEGKAGYEVSEETRRKIGAKNSSPERVEARIAAVKTPEARARMSKGQRASWTAERRASFAKSKQGDGSYCAKVTESDVRAIRAKLAAGESCASIGRSYGMTPEAISRIKHRKTWTHVS